MALRTTITSSVGKNVKVLIFAFSRVLNVPTFTYMAFTTFSPIYVTCVLLAKKGPCCARLGVCSCARRVGRKDSLEMQLHFYNKDWVWRACSPVHSECHCSFSPVRNIATIASPARARSWHDRSGSRYCSASCLPTGAEALRLCHVARHDVACPLALPRVRQTSNISASAPWPRENLRRRYVP